MPSIIDICNYGQTDSKEIVSLRMVSLTQIICPLGVRADDPTHDSSNQKIIIANTLGLPFPFRRGFHQAGPGQPLACCSPEPTRGGGYLQLLGVGGERLHPPRGRGAPQQQGEAGELPGRAADVQALQRVQVELPDLDGCCQPGVPAAQTDGRGSLTASAKEPVSVPSVPRASSNGDIARLAQKALACTAGMLWPGVI